MLKGLTNTFKNNCNNVELTYKEYIKLDNEIIPIKAQLKDDTYENGNFIGTFILKEIQFETEATYEFRNKEFEYYKVVDNESIKIGTFISTDITINDTTNIVKVVGMDYGLKTQIQYTSSLDYASGEITLLDVWNECCELSGLESGITDFVNSDFIVDSDQFTGTGATVRDVFKAIAMSSGTFVKVMNDDKIYLIFNELTSDIENIEINGSATIQDGYKLVDLQLQGNTTQSGTPTPDSPQPINVVSGRQDIKVEGKQLLPYPYNETTKTTGGITYTDNGDGSITISNTATANAYFNIFPNTAGIRPKYKAGTYTFSNNKLLPSGITITFSARNSDGTVISGVSAVYLNNTTKEATRTINQDFEIFCNVLVSNGTALSTPITVYPMIEKGSSATTFEEYKGQSYEINLGKNLFDKETTGTTSNATKSVLDNGIRITLTSAGTYRYYYMKIGGQELLGETITISSNITPSASNTGALYLFFGNSSVPSISSIGNLTTSGSKTITIPNSFPTNSDRIYLLAYGNTGGTGNVDDYVDYTNLQIEKGSTATDYAPYKTPIELCKIGDYKDRIYKDSGKWYLEKNIGKVVLNGTQNITLSNWRATASSVGWIYPYSIINSITSSSIGTTPQIICNKLIPANINDLYYGVVDNGIGLWQDTSYGIVVRTSNTSLTNVSLINTYLSNNPMSVYVPLATPTYTEITDSELISQLESIELIEGLNNIFITSNYLTGKLKLSYYNNNFDIIEDYVELEDKRDTHPWTCLRLGVSNIDGENIDYIDQDLVDLYGENWLILNDNPFAYNQSKRQELIEDIFNQIKGFGYSAYVSKTSFKPYLTSGDIIKFKNRDGEFVKSILLRYNHNVESIQLEAPSETSATVNYVHPLSAMQVAKNTQIIVNKDTQEISAIAQSMNALSSLVDSQGNEIDALGTRLTQTTQDITASVSAVQSELENGVSLVKTTSVTIDNNGLNVSTDTSKISTTMTNNSFEIKDSGDTTLAYFGYDENEQTSKAEMDNLTVKTYFITGVHRFEKYEENAEERTGMFYIGG